MTEIIESSSSSAKNLYISDLEERAAQFASDARAANTIKAYSSDWRQFSTWCDATNHNALPASPRTVALFITDISKSLRVSSIKRMLTAISQAHQIAGHTSPTTSPLVREVVKGVSRINGTAPAAKTAIGTNELKAMVTSTANDLQGIRDRAILLLGFIGAFRRSELVAIDVADIEEIPEQGLCVTLRSSKTDTIAKGRSIGIPYGRHKETCAVIAYRSWRDHSGISDGPLFRIVTKTGKVLDDRLSDRAVARLIKRQINTIGLDPRRYSGHSLRSGFCTAAASSGVPERLIMRTTGHRSVEMLRRYIHQGTIFSENAATALDL